MRALGQLSPIDNPTCMQDTYKICIIWTKNKNITTLYVHHNIPDYKDFYIVYLTLYLLLLLSQNSSDVDPISVLCIRIILCCISETCLPQIINEQTPYNSSNRPALAPPCVHYVELLQFPRVLSHHTELRECALTVIIRNISRCDNNGHNKLIIHMSDSHQHERADNSYALTSCNRTRLRGCL